MEFIVANKKFSNSTHVSDNIYISGEYKDVEGILIIQDGFTLTSEAFDQISNNDKNEVFGCYNIIKIDKGSGVITTYSDKRNYIPLYKYEKGDSFGLSNNPWILAKVFEDEIEIDEQSLMSQLVYIVDVNPDRTLIKNLSRIKAGERLEYDVRNKTLKSVVNYHFQYEPKDNISLQQELEYADEQFTRYFEFIKEHNSDRVTGFGCSGGLDSRLIAHYTNKVGIKPKYYVIGDAKPNKVLKSVTYIVSNEVAKLYNHVITQIPYKISWLEQSLLLDIRNHPFFFAQIFLNPINDLPDYELQFSGDPGAYAYLDSSIISSDLDSLKHHADFYLSMRKDAQCGWIDTIRKMSSRLGIKINKASEDGFLGLRKSMIDRNIDSYIIDKTRSELYNIIDNAPGINNVEKWYYIHDNITTRYQYASAYSSMNLKKRLYPLYYPFFYEQIKHFPYSYLKNKFFLKKLLLFVSPEYANIPDQNLNYIDKKYNVLYRAINRAELALRGRGLQIRDLIKKQEYRDLFKNVYLRKNPIFEKYVNTMSILNSNLPYTYAGTQFLKLKMVLDYIYYKDFDSLINLKEFYIES